MAYITGVKAKKKVASKRRPSQDVGKHLSTHMDNARKANMTPTGQKRAHPFLDANGSNSQSPPKILLDQAGKTSIHVEDVEDITEV